MFPRYGKYTEKKCRDVRLSLSSLSLSLSYRGGGFLFYFPHRAKKADDYHLLSTALTVNNTSPKHEFTYMLRCVAAASQYHSLMRELCTLHASPA